MAVSPPVNQGTKRGLKLTSCLDTGDHTLYRYPVASVATDRTLERSRTALPKALRPYFLLNVQNAASLLRA
ncbi:hypothetical protein AGJ21_17245 [Cronobacter sakazakii]|nr:hypothetical protein [Cronobacter sakazakii]